MIWLWIRSYICTFIEQEVFQCLCDGRTPQVKGGQLCSTSVCFIHVCPERDETDSSLHLASEFVLVRFHFLLAFDFICRKLWLQQKNKTKQKTEKNAHFVLDLCLVGALHLCNSCRVYFGMCKSKCVWEVYCAVHMYCKVIRSQIVFFISSR